MKKTPLVTVLMPVYNTEKFLKKAIESILSQTYKDFEFLIINDGSTDLSRKIINSYSDKRIVSIDNEQNLGLIASLNIGINLAKGKYIVRMDSDDISMPERIEKQVTFMENNVDIDISGGGYIFLKKFRKIKVTPINEPHRTKCELIFTVPLHHPTIIIRKSSLINKNLYYPNVECAEDYALWVNSFDLIKMTNISDVLIYYRVHDNQVSNKMYLNQINSIKKVKKSLLDKLNFDLSEKELNDLVACHSCNFCLSETSIEDIEQLLLKLINLNKKNRVFSEDLFREVVSKYWGISCFNIAKKGYFVWNNIYKSSLTDKSHYALIFNLKLILGYLLRP